MRHLKIVAASIIISAYAMTASAGRPKILFLASPVFASQSSAHAKTSADKFIHIANIGLDLNSYTDIHYLAIEPKYSKDKTVEQLMQESEMKYKENLDSEQKRQKKKDNGKEKLKDDEDKGELKYDDSEFGENAFKTLKSLGYIDTVNRVFQDENNTVVLSGKISAIDFFTLLNKSDKTCRGKVFMTWYIKNRYGEKLDSLTTSAISRDFLMDKSDDYSAYIEIRTNKKRQSKMIENAIDSSVVGLLSNPLFKKYMKSEPVPEYAGEVLRIAKPSAIVEDKGDAAMASVIVKREDHGHGSGFAISQDGYIITNYHVICTSDPAKMEKLKVVTSDGQELDATIVRYSKARDIALLKVEKKFDKAFLLSDEKKFKNLQDVYTVGAPKSIELGQTVTAGIISNERNSNNNELLQLSMAVNFGNSGGPLFDKSGTLQGVIVAKLVGESTEGIGFAIPSYKLGKYINISY